MAIGREWAIWAALALMGGCNTFDDSPDDSQPRDLLPSGSPVGRPLPPAFPMGAGSGVFFPASGTGAVGAIGAAGAAGMPVRWQPIDAGPPISIDADGGDEDAGTAKPTPR
jgi:hypothetical protein